jgi:class 3 adenylate cyclase
VNDAAVRDRVERSGASATQLRLLLEELCCDLVRFAHVCSEGLAPESIAVDREVYMGTPGAFADIRVQPPGRRPYFVEVKFGYPDAVLAHHLARKYGPGSGAAIDGAEKLVLVVDVAGRSDWPARLQAIAQSLAPGMAIEVWDEAEFLRRLAECFGVSVDTISTDRMIDVRNAVDRAKGYHAFGGESLEAYEHDPLKEELLWHFGFWRLRQLRDRHGLGPREILVPGIYRNVVVVLADICSFSSFMRDTPDAELTRESLTTFYSMARDQIINRGGMLYQFVGDEAIGIFGIPEADDDAPAQALAVARSLHSVGASVSHHWQRHIDRVQPSGGVHIGMAQGDVQIVSLRPFSRTHVGALGDCINVAARLMGSAGPGEIVATNSLYRRFSPADREGFAEIPPAEAKNVGRISAWKARLGVGWEA